MKFFKRTVSPPQGFKKILFFHFYFVVAIASATLLYFLFTALFVVIGYSMSGAGILQNLSEILEKVGYAVLPFIIGVLIIYLPAIPYGISIFFGDQAGYFLELAFSKKEPIWARILVAFLGTTILIVIFYVFFVIGLTAIDLYSKINELLGMNVFNFLKEAFNS
tara:strand:- start:1048 stop:1539 length:492 start_codon:yes stop_codon:yes gene_type:complete